MMTWFIRKRERIHALLLLFQRSIQSYICIYLTQDHRLVASTMFNDLNICRVYKLHKLLRYLNYF